MRYPDFVEGSFMVVDKRSFDSTPLGSLASQVKRQDDKEEFLILYYCKDWFHNDWNEKNIIWLIGMFSMTVVVI